MGTVERAPCATLWTAHGCDVKCTFVGIIVLFACAQYCRGQHSSSHLGIFLFLPLCLVRDESGSGSIVPRAIADRLFCPAVYSCFGGLWKRSDHVPASTK